MIFNTGTGGESPQQGGSPQQRANVQHVIHMQQQGNPMTKIAWGQLIVSALNFVFSLLIPMFLQL
jgi:hypothetical protein